MENLELKPCPFCGSKATIIDVSSYRYDIQENKLFEVGCVNYQCHAYIYEDTPRYDTKEEAATLWNNRVNLKYWPCGVHKSEDGWEYLGSVSYLNHTGVDIYRQLDMAVYGGISMQNGPADGDYYSFGAIDSSKSVISFEHAIMVAYAIRYDRKINK